MILQRLFSTFANGWPGKGLLVLRMAISAFLIHNGYILSTTSASLTGFAASMIAFGAAIFLLTGLWTPVAGGIAATLELCSAFFEMSNFWAHLLAVAIAVAVAMVGPGAWSIDARFYGRKRISLQDY